MDGFREIYAIRVLNLCLVLLDALAFEALSKLPDVDAERRRKQEQEDPQLDQRNLWQ